MTSKLIQDIEKARSKGHKITYRKRSDGGYIVTSVDGVSYNGAKGNAKVRKIVGSNISEYRSRQLETIKPKRGKDPRARKTDKASIEDQIRRQKNRINRKRRKNEIEGGGTITNKKIQYNINKYGVEETMRRLDQAERYAEGYANEENIDWLLKRIEREKNLSDKYSKEWEDIYNRIEKNRRKFRESTLSETYNILGSPKAKNTYMGLGEKKQINRIKKLLDTDGIL